jgi:hypothetical protein
VPAVRHLLAHRNLAVLLCAATLLLRLLLPTGYMIGSDHGQLTVELCSGVASPETGMLAQHMSEHGKPGEHGKAELPCAFSGLSAAALGAVDPIQLTALIAFIMAVGLFPAVLPAPGRRIYLRPPLRGPPANL